MRGTMMEVPMLLSHLIDYAGDYHPRTEVVARHVDGAVERATWASLRSRAKRLAHALDAHGCGLEASIGSLAWNTLDHLELYYAALGIGAPLHTINPRLSPDDMRYMVEKVGQSIMFVDDDTLAAAEALAPLVPQVTTWVHMGRDRTVPPSSIRDLISKQDFVAGFDDAFAWPSFDEYQAATICFTSGTTGRPKGVVYSHRSLTLTAMNMTMADMYGNARNGGLECMMPLAPMFHANGWMMPFTAPMNGHKLVLPGRDLSAAPMVELMRAEDVTTAGAVPTVWGDILTVLEQTHQALPALRTALIAGTRPSSALLTRLRDRGLDIRQCWGMTEVPGATRASLPPGADGLAPSGQQMIQDDRQGRVGFQAQLRLIDDDGNVLGLDSARPGHLQVRGPVVAGGYLGDPPQDRVDWLPTGDIARLHPDSTLEIVDRAKDVIKSGGEWISSPQLESAAMSHPAVALAAAIGVPHERWEERPLLFCTTVDGATVSPEDIKAHMASSVVKWWLPDEVRFIDQMPLAATGKIDKVALRRMRDLAST